MTNEDNKKPELRILKYNFSENKFEILGELDTYISYVYKLNWNTSSTGELKIDPQEPQAKEYIELLNDSSWDSKLEDIFIYNINDKSQREFFKIEKTEIQVKADKKTITLSGSNDFFMKDRLAYPDTQSPNFSSGKITYTNQTMGYICNEILMQNGVSKLRFAGATETYGDLNITETFGNSTQHKEKRRFPYLAIWEDGISLGETLDEFKFGFENVRTTIDKLVKGTLYGYEIRLKPELNVIEWVFKTFNDNTDLEISQEFQNENGYKVIIDGVRKIDAAIYYKDGQTALLENSGSLSAGRYIEKKVSNSKQDTPNSLQTKLAQELIKNSDYKITDVSIIPITDNPITSEIELGDLITVTIDEGIVKINKTSQIKQLLKVASDNEYKITPIADDSAQSGLSLLAEKLRETNENIDSENY